MTYNRSTWLLPVLRDAGLKVETVSGWESRGRPASTGDYDPGGLEAHHTGTRTLGDRPSLKLLIEGRPDLPGPLSQLMLTRSGVYVVIAAGRANHAGRCNGAGILPVGDGNALLIGTEVETSGYAELTPEQDVALRIGSAAILRKLVQLGKVPGGVTLADLERALFLHATTSVTGKWDLAENGKTVSLSDLRADVKVAAARLAPRPPSRTAPRLPVVDLSRTAAAFRLDPKRRQGSGTYEAGVKLVEVELAALGYLPRAYAFDGYAGTLTRDAYAKWQRHLGYRRADADGTPGTTSLVKLGARRKRFKVTA